MKVLFRQMGEWLLTLCRSVIPVWALIAVWLLSAISPAGELKELSVTEADGEFTLRIVSVLDAPVEEVYKLITDYRHAYRINPAITSVDILPSGRDGAVRVQNRSEHRIGLFSFEVEWVGDIVETERGRISITTIPKMGSFESGSAVWEIRPLGNRTWVLHESTLNPKFPIIPIIGTYIMKRHMKKAALATFNRIECQAQNMLQTEREEGPERLEVALKERGDCTQSR